MVHRAAMYNPAIMSRRRLALERKLLAPRQFLLSSKYPSCNDGINSAEFGNRTNSYCPLLSRNAAAGHAPASFLFSQVEFDCFDVAA